MFLFRNRLATGAIIAIIMSGIKVAFDIVYGLLKALKLQLLLSALFVGAILFLTKVLPENQTLLFVFIGFVALGFFYAVLGNVNRVKKLFSGANKRRTEKLKERAEREEQEEFKQKREEQIRQEEREKIEQERLLIQNGQASVPKKTESYPKYYKVKQNNNYVMAEYRDRYELYVKKDGKLFKVRTDKKGDYL